MFVHASLYLTGETELEALMVIELKTSGDPMHRMSAVLHVSISSVDAALSECKEPMSSHSNFKE